MCESQKTIGAWQRETFGDDRMRDLTRTFLRTFEEVIELAHAARIDRDDLIALVRKTYLASAEKATRTGRYPSLSEEVADVLITVLGLADNFGIDAQASIDAKMRVNRSRTWYVREDGRHQHHESKD